MKFGSELTKEFLRMIAIQRHVEKQSQDIVDW